MYDAVPPKLKRSLVKCWHFLAVNYREGPVGEIQHRGLLGRRVVQMLPFSFLRSTFATTASRPSPCIFLAL